MFSSFQFTIPIGQVSSIDVLVSGEAGQPLEGVPVQLTVQSNNPDCFGLQCGQVYGTSLTMVLSGSNGVCQFILGFTGGETGSYTFTATVIHIDSTLLCVVAHQTNCGGPRTAYLDIWLPNTGRISQGRAHLDPIGDLRTPGDLCGAQSPRPATNIRSDGITKQAVSASLHRRVFNAVVGS